MRRALLVAVLLVIACKTAPAPCAWNDFTITVSHMTNEYKTPFVMRELRGRFRLGERPMPAGMMEFQVMGPRGFSMMVPLRPDGTFHVPGVPPGRYCFRTGSDQFQGYEGVIVIDPRADPAAELDIDVALAA